jgi:guanylate kinase
MNELQRLEEFQQILDDYRVSEAGQALLSEVRLVLLAAPTSSGRNTIINELSKNNEYHYIVSDTTRQPRINDGKAEENGQQYWFRKEDEVLDDLRAGRFLEAAIIHNQQVSGISLRELELARQENKIAITDIEVVGVQNIVAAKPDTTVVFVVPPSFEEWQRRILLRGAMEPAEFIRRLTSSLHEFQHALDKPYYHYVVNDNLQHAVAQIHDVASNPSEAKKQDEANRRLVEKLCTATADFLKTHTGQP